jgi:hypothetical protein
MLSFTAPYPHSKKPGYHVIPVEFAGGDERLTDVSPAQESDVASFEVGRNIGSWCTCMYDCDVLMVELMPVLDLLETEQKCGGIERR